MGASLTANHTGVIAGGRCECNRSARGADAACAPKPAIARTTAKAKSTPPNTQNDSGARVRLPVDLFETLDTGVRIDLRRADARVPEQFLHRP